ncbi:MAG: fatty acid desaturase [Pyrinomonadaceae bacterium]
MEKILQFRHAKSDKFQWSTLIGLAVFHAFAVWAMFAFSWQNLLIAGFLWLVSGSWGIGLGYHRLLTHGGYKAPKWLEYLLTLCGTLALQSGAISWVATHRIHHKYTETDGDPHSPRGGVFWAHMGWILQGTAQMQDEATMGRYAPDLMKDKNHRLMNKYYWLTSVIVGAVLFAVGGWSMVLWGIFLRTVIGWHATWLVNSATHLWGTRRFETHDDSRNNALIAAITFGEGWHNNHHAHPRSARHGLAWYEFDFNWMQIRLLERVGLIKKVYAYRLKDETKTEEIVPEPLQEAA